MDYELTVEPLGERVRVKEGQTILDACLRHGLYLPHACTHGRCSTCKVEVVEGEVDIGEATSFALMDFEREEGKRLACTATLRSDAVIEADVDEDEDAERHPVVDRVGRVARIWDASPTIKGIELELDEDFEFQAGQYLNLHLPGLPRPRAFSMANPPSENRRIELHVKRVPEGRGTAYIHEQLEVGDELRFSGPYGQFFVRHSKERPMIFVAGGSGLSAVRSMILDLMDEGLDEPCWLFYGARTEEELVDHARWLELAEEEDDFHYVPALSHCPEDSGWSGCTGFVHEALAEPFDGRFSGKTAYLCGPPRMIDAGLTTLMQGRLFERDIFTEKFFSEADGDAALSKSPLFRRI